MAGGGRAASPPAPPRRLGALAPVVSLLVFNLVIKFSIMVTIKDFNEHGLAYLAMGIADLMKGSISSSKENGCWVDINWLTPETCYWFYKFLKSYADAGIVSKDLVEILKNGTNHPEML